MLYFLALRKKQLQDISYILIDLITIYIYILRLLIILRFDIPRYSHVQHTELAICNKLMYVDYY